MLALLAAISARPMIAQWVQTNTGLTSPNVHAFAVSPNGTGGTNLFAGTYGGGAFLSTNNGTSWTAVNTGLTSAFVFVFAVSPNGTGGTNLPAGQAGLFAGTNSGVFLSTNNGTSWTAINTGLTSTLVLALAVSPDSGGTGGTSIFAGTSRGGVFLSTNNGTSWTQVNTGLMNTNVLSLAVSPKGTGGTNLFVGTYDGVYLSTNNGTSWARAGLRIAIVHALAVSGTNLFAATQSGVFLSTNNGTGWRAVNTGLTDTQVSSLAVSGTDLPAGQAGLFAGTNSGVFLSTNNGTSWTAINTGLTNTTIETIAVIPNGTGGQNLFAGTWGGGAWRRPLSEMITSVEMVSGLLPSYFNLKQNYPNPFNPSTTIEFSLAKRTFVSLKIFDALGGEMLTLISQEMSAGTYSRQWNAEGLGSGVYFCRLQADQFRETRRLLLLR